MIEIKYSGRALKAIGLILGLAFIAGFSVWVVYMVIDMLQMGIAAIIGSVAVVVLMVALWGLIANIIGVLKLTNKDKE